LKETFLTSPAQGRTEERWQAHPVLSGLLSAAIFMIPIAAALGTTWTVRSFIPTPADPMGRVLWWGMLLALGVIVAMVVERVSRRLVPLATLLKLSMLFPDRAPSRFRIARKSGSLKHLESLQTRSGDAGDSATKILTLVTALSSHDKHTRGHAERVRVFTDMLSEQLDLPERDRYRLRWASLLHDIGKLTIDPDILNKSSKLNEQQWALIREHPAEGVRIAGPLIEWLGPWGGAIAHHHERFDGTGYPAGLAGEQISLGGRIVSVVDAYATMTSARSYQKPKATAAARRELVAHAGTQFDGAIVRAFLAISLPRLLWATGPLSLAVHIPFLGQLQQIGQTSLAAASQTATVTAVAGVTAMGFMAPGAVAKPDHQPNRTQQIVVMQSSSLGEESPDGTSSENGSGTNSLDRGPGSEPRSSAGSANQEPDRDADVSTIDDGEAEAEDGDDDKDRDDKDRSDEKEPRGDNSDSGNSGSPGGSNSGSSGGGNSGSGNSGSGNSGSGNSGSGNSGSGNSGSGNSGSGGGSSGHGSGHDSDDDRDDDDDDDDLRRSG
jgi:uncharacterized membrane protein YgcG